MHLDQHVHAERERRVLDVPRRGVIERGHDDEDAIGAHRAGFRDLVGLEHEVLAQRRQRGCRASGREKLRLALERRTVGQHRQTGCAASLVPARELRGIEVGANEPRRGAGLLNFGDQRIFAAGDPPFDGVAESARGGGGLGGGLDIGVRARALGGGDLLAFVGLDFLEDIAHDAFEIATSRPSRPSASPLSIDFAAIAAPALRSLARPETTSAAAALSTAMSRYGPLSPLSTPMSAVALASASPPRSASGFERAI